MYVKSRMSSKLGLIEPEGGSYGNQTCHIFIVGDVCEER